MVNTSGSGDHPDEQAAAGQAVSGNPPSVATLTAYLPPPAPSTSDAAARPRARGSDSPDDPHPSTATRRAGERPSDDDVNNPRFLDCPATPLDGHIDTALPLLTSYAGPGSGAATQIGTALECMDEEDAPVPPAQIGADFERIDATINELMKTPLNVEGAPMHLSQIAADFNDVDKAIEVPQIVEQEETLKQAQNPPTPVVARAPSPPPMDFENMNAASLQRMNERVQHQQEEIFHQAQDPPTPAVVRPPSPPPMDQGRRSSNLSGPQQIPLRSPPQSMMPSPDEGADPLVSVLSHDPSVPILEAFPVEDQPVIQIYNGVQVAEQTWLEKNKKISIGLGMGLLIGAAVAAGVSVSAIKSTSNSETIKPEGVALPTSLPPESSSPLEVPSLQSTTRPPESSFPSDVPSQSANPSQSPSQSLRPSLFPSISTSPTSFCFSGEINILTDSYPEETSWTISRIDGVDGVANTKVVLEGFPEEKLSLTSNKVCLERGDYEFAILDSYRDGIRSPGYYSVTFEGVVIAQGGKYEAKEKVSSSLPFPSPPPSESSSPNESPSASFQPSESIIPSQSLTPSFQPSNSFSPSTYLSSLNWSRQGTGFRGESSGDRLGKTVAFSADALTMAVGAPGPWGNIDRPGYVKIYHREGEGSSWEQQGETIEGEANGDLFGMSLSLSDDGTTLSIGAPSHDFDGSVSGQVKVYKWDEAALNYVQIGDSLYVAGTLFAKGYSLDISNGTILAVGVPYSNADCNDLGKVTVYAWDNESSNFKQRGEAICGDANDFFGMSISLARNGQKLVVGAPYSDSNSREAGQVRVFAWDEDTLSYEQSGDPLVGDAFGGLFGSSVSFSGDGTALAIGAPYNSENGLHSGQVKVFTWDEAVSNFQQIGQSLHGKASGDEFGTSVLLSPEGKTLAIGAPRGGYVEIYRWDEASLEYKQFGKSLGSKGPRGSFGEALALAANGRVLAVGDPRYDRKGLCWGGWRCTTLT